jgi:TonB family protein
MFTDATLTKPYQPEGIYTKRTLTAQVETFIDSNGHVVQATLYKSSGSDNADAQAVAAAQLSKFAPATLLCTPVVGRYLFRVDFAP